MMSQQNHVSARDDGIVWKFQLQTKPFQRNKKYSCCFNLTLNSGHCKHNDTSVVASVELIVSVYVSAGEGGHAYRSILSWGWLNVACMNHDFPHCRSQSSMSHEQVLYGNRQGTHTLTMLCLNGCRSLLLICKNYTLNQRTNLKLSNPTASRSSKLQLKDFNVFMKTVSYNHVHKKVWLSNNPVHTQLTEAKSNTFYILVKTMKNAY